MIVIQIREKKLKKTNIFDNHLPNVKLPQLAPNKRR